MKYALLIAAILLVGCERVEQSADPDVSSGVDMVDQLEIPKLLERVDPSSATELEIQADVENRSVIYGQAIESRISGKVVSVVNGDTIKVSVNNKELTVRLACIDSPEVKEQPFGKSAKSSLSILVANQTVNVLVTGQDRYQRTLGFVNLPLNTFAVEVNVNQLMLESGLAWHCDAYCQELADFENKARENKKGLWAGRSDLDRLPPWEWRRGLRSWSELQARNQ